MKDFSELPIHDWAEKRIKEMSGRESSYAEERFLDLCKGFRYSLFRQVFFMIDGKCYFLDFYIPFRNLAVEIDGKYHNNKDRKARDEARDAAFKSIGIKTIRFTTRQMMSPGFIEDYYKPALSPVGKRIRPKQNQTNHQERLLRVIRAIKGLDKRARIEIRSGSMPFLCAVSQESKPRDNARDLVLLSEFYDIKRDLELDIAVRYIGKRENLKKYDKRKVLSWDESCEKGGGRTTIVI